MSDDAALLQYTEAIAQFMRDRPDLNRLISGVEHDENRRTRAVYEALTNYTLADCPYPVFLSDMAVLRLLKSLYLLLERNDTDVQDAGGVASKKNQVATLPKTIESMERTVLAKLSEAKKARALFDAIGASGTHYSSYYTKRW
jgi:hypothetical protein